jgi:hypothetical protein
VLLEKTQRSRGEPPPKGVDDDRGPDAGVGVGVGEPVCIGGHDVDGTERADGAGFRGVAGLAPDQAHPADLRIAIIASGHLSNAVGGALGVPVVEVLPFGRIDEAFELLASATVGATASNPWRLSRSADALLSSSAARLVLMRLRPPAENPPGAAVHPAQVNPHGYAALGSAPDPQVATATRHGRGRHRHFRGVRGQRHASATHCE